MPSIFLFLRLVLTLGHLFHFVFSTHGSKYPSGSKDDDDESDRRSSSSDYDDQSSSSDGKKRRKKVKKDRKNKKDKKKKKEVKANMLQLFCYFGLKCYGDILANT